MNPTFNTVSTVVDHSSDRGAVTRPQHLVASGRNLYIGKYFLLILILVRHI